MKKIVFSILLMAFCFSAFAQTNLYRYYNPKAKKHFFTANFNELGNGANGFVLEGVACRIYAMNRVPGLVPVYRMYNPKSNDHYYTSRRYVPGRDLDGYQSEGNLGFVFRHQQPGTMPLFEYYNPQIADHFYTIDKNELGAGFEGYVFDTVVGYVYRKP
jgi:hypothetical protein